MFNFAELPRVEADYLASEPYICDLRKAVFISGPHHILSNMVDGFGSLCASWSWLPNTMLIGSRNSLARLVTHMIDSSFRVLCSVLACLCACFQSGSGFTTSGDRMCDSTSVLGMCIHVGNVKRYVHIDRVRVQAFANAFNECAHGVRHGVWKSVSAGVTRITVSTDAIVYACMCTCI